MESRLFSVDSPLMSSSLKRQQSPMISIPVRICYPRCSRLHFLHSPRNVNVLRGSHSFSRHSNGRPKRLPSLRAVSAFSSVEGGERGEKSHGFLERALVRFSLLRSVLPGGSWWELPDWEEERGEKRATAVTVSFALKRMWVLVAKDRWIIFFGFLSVFLAAVSEISIPHFLAASIFSAQSQQAATFQRNSKFLALLCFSSGIFSGLRGCCFGIANMILVKRMREMLYSAVLFQDISFFDSETVGDLTSRLGADCQQVSRVIGNDLQFIARNIFQGGGALIFLFSLSWPLALSTLAICSVLVTIMVFYGKYQKRAAKLTQEYSACATDVAQETFSLMRTVRVYGTEMQESKRFQQWLKKLADLSMRQSMAFGLWISSFNFLYHSTRFTAVLVGGASIMAGHITAEQLTKFILYCEWLIYATWWVGDSWSNLMQSVGASEKVFQLMDLLPSEQFLSEGQKLEQLKGHIQFVNVSFHYASRNLVSVLKNINISIQPSEVVALVGLSGSGKTTLVNLLLRLYEPTEGQILIDGYPLRELDIKWLRENIGYVGQEPRLFRMDVESNIKYGCPREVGHEDVVMAAKLAFAHDFIMSFPDGYGTLVDNDLLSGGQKQRIAIARALLRDPAILIFDEATSALDAESEHFVKEVLTGSGNGSLRKRTVIIIAHRLSTVQAADRIVVMEGGRIVEMGNHSELICQDGAYARLTKKQMDGSMALQN